MQFRSMKIYFLSTVAVIFLNLQHFSAEDCPTETKCLQPNLKPGKPLEIGFLYDLNDNTNFDGLQKLNNIVCEVIKEFGDCLSFRRYPGAAVVATADGIKCLDDCFRNRDNACIGFANDKYFSTCEGSATPQPAVKACYDNNLADTILKDNGSLRCSLGIPIDKLPALIFDKSYVSCDVVTSADQLKTILCNSFGTDLKGCGNGQVQEGQETEGQ